MIVFGSEVGPGPAQSSQKAMPAARIASAGVKSRRIRFMAP
jgi:hypothetical protein